MRRNPVLVSLLALLAGCLHVLAFSPFGFWPLAFVSVAILAMLLERAHTPRQGFGMGLVWGFGLFAAGISWLYIALHRYGGMPAILAIIAIGLFCVYLALYPALAGAFFVRLRHHSPSRKAALLSALWMLTEWLRGTLFTGFPWLATGYVHTPPSPFSAYQPLIGVYGVSGITFFISALWAFTLWHKHRAILQTLSITAMLVIGGVGFSFVSWTQPAGAPFKVSLLQTNIPQGLKWDPSHTETSLRKQAQLVRNHPADLVVLPETTLPMLIESLPEGYLAQLRQYAYRAEGDIVFGIFTQNAQGALYNSAVSIGRSPSQTYAKRHLVPFGEYSPPLFGWFYRLVNIPLSSQSQGQETPPMQLGEQRVAVNICYEDLFGSDLLYNVPEATLLLNLSNLAWYGDSLAQPQHLQIAQVRALETGRPMLRSTNTGMTAIVQPDGRISHALPPFTEGALQASVEGYQGLTPFVRWGDKLTLVIAVVILLLSARYKRVNPHDYHPFQ